MASESRDQIFGQHCTLWSTLVVVPGSPDADARAVCTVAEAADLLGGCTTQTVRNLLAKGLLSGQQVARGRRTNVWQVTIASIYKHLEQHGSPARQRRQAPPGTRLDDLERRLRTLEQTPAPRADQQPDLSNLQFANLRLLQIQESYERTVALLLAADDQRRRAQDGLAAIATDYRAVIEQFLLPPGPPTE